MSQNMHIVSARDFRANQKKYFDLAETETVFVARMDNLVQAHPHLRAFVKGKKGLVARP